MSPTRIVEVAVEENHSSVRVKNLKQLSNLSAETKTRKKNQTLYTGQPLTLASCSDKSHAHDESGTFQKMCLNDKYVV